MTFVKHVILQKYFVIIPFCGEILLLNGSKLFGVFAVAGFCTLFGFVNIVFIFVDTGSNG